MLQLKSIFWCIYLCFLFKYKNCTDIQCIHTTYRSLLCSIWGLWAGLKYYAMYNHHILKYLYVRCYACMMQCSGSHRKQSMSKYHIHWPWKEDTRSQGRGLQVSIHSTFLGSASGLECLNNSIPIILFYKLFLKIASFFVQGLRISYWLMIILNN